MNLVLRIRDERGAPAVGVRVNRYADYLARFLDYRITDATGTVSWYGIENVPYRISVYNYDHGVPEYWAYRTVFRNPVPDGGTYTYTIPREAPYLNAVEVSPSALGVGQPVSVTLSHRDGYAVHNFNNHVMLEAILDRDQAPPYDLSATAGPFPIQPGSITTTLVFTPTVPGLYHVRPIVTENWEDGPYSTTDDGWWNWSVAVAVETETPTATPVPSETPTATAVPTSTPTATAVPTVTPTVVPAGLAIFLPCILLESGWVG